MSKAIRIFSLVFVFSFLTWGMLYAGALKQVPRKSLIFWEVEPSAFPDTTVSSLSEGVDPTITWPSGRSAFKSKESKKASSRAHFQVKPLQVGLKGYDNPKKGATDIRVAPFNLKVIPAEAIERMPVTDIEDILADQVGVVQMRRPGYEGFYFHGGRRDEVTYLLDGVDITDPFSHSLGITLDKDAISQIWLYPGWFPAEYGGAMSGVVDISTKDETERYKGTIEYGSDGILKDGANHLGYNRVRFNLGGPLPTAFKSNFFLSGNLWNADNWSPGIVPKPHNDKDQRNIFAKLSLRPVDNLKLTIGGSSAYERYHLYDHQRSRGDWLKDGPLYEDGNSLVYLRLNHSLNQNISYTLNLSALFHKFGDVLLRCMG